MSVKAVPCFTVLCDVCGADALEGGDYSGFADATYVEDEAEDSGWMVECGNHLCEDCTPTDREDEP